MKKLLTAMFVALLMVGCGGAKNDEDSNADNDHALAPPADEWAKYGGPIILGRIERAKESNGTTLNFHNGLYTSEKQKIYDVTPLKGLTKLEYIGLVLDGPFRMCGNFSRFGF